MTDEKFLFQQDVRQKSNVAKSARHRRTHTGKSGGVKLPSDYMTEKERNAMNGNVESYRLNDPMTWDEFNKMPDDIKVLYIKALRQKYGVSDSRIAGMMGLPQVTFSKEVRRLGLGMGRYNTQKVPFNKEAWVAWCYGAPAPEKVKEEVAQDIPTQAEEAAPVTYHTEKAIPRCGSLTFDGSVKSAFDTVSVLLGGANVRITITWELLDNG